MAPACAETMEQRAEDKPSNSCAIEEETHLGLKNVKLAQVMESCVGVACRDEMPEVEHLISYSSIPLP